MLRSGGFVSCRALARGRDLFSRYACGTLAPADEDFTRA
jgi:hypothetical protein